MNTENVSTEEHTAQEIADVSTLPEMQEALSGVEKLTNSEQDVNDSTEEKDSEEEQDLQEAGNEEESVLDSDDRETPSKKDKSIDDDRVWKAKKEKYKVLAEKEALKEEVDQLKNMLSESLNSGTYHYGKSAYFEVEKAKENKKRAIEKGDADALIEADIDLTKALNTVYELEKWNSTQGSNNPQDTKSVQKEQSSANELQQEMARDWLEGHEYLQPSSPHYNINLANNVGEFINYLDANLAKNNQEHTYFTKEYFNTIDKYIVQVKNSEQKGFKSPESSNHVGAVRKNSQAASTNSKAQSSTQLVLTADEKRMCANAGISEKDWLRYKIEDLKKEK